MLRLLIAIDADGAGFVGAADGVGEFDVVGARGAGGYSAAAAGVASAVECCSVMCYSAGRS